MDNKIQPAQIRCIKTLMGKLKTPDGDAVVRGFTKLRTGHVSEMTVKEGGELIKHLKKLDPDEVAANKMRRKLIGMAYERAGLGRSAGSGERRAVVDQLDAWCKQYGYKHKALNSYTKNELPKLVSQYQQVYKDLLERI
jgi:hypothetical protein